MSIFGDIADAVGGAVSWAEGAVSDVSHSAVGSTLLDIGGSFFGDPTLGEQVKGATGVIDKFFGKGSPAGKIVAHQARPAALGHRGASPRSPTGAVRFRGKSGRVYTVTRRQLASLRELLKKRSAAAQILALPNPLALASPPVPPPQVVPPAAVASILQNADAVRAAVDAGSSIQLPSGHVIDTTQPVLVPPAWRDAVNATGLDAGQPQYVAAGAAAADDNSRVTRDL